MKKHIGVKMVEAEPMGLIKWKELQNIPLVGNFHDEDGYLVLYPDGHRSWSPKRVFEDAYLPLDGDDGTKAVALTFGDVINFVPAVLESKIGEKTCVVQAQCRTGFEITGTAACVDPAQYDHNTGRFIAIDKIRDQLWAHLGFVMQWAKNGLFAFACDPTMTEETNTKGE